MKISILILINLMISSPLMASSPESEVEGLSISNSTTASEDTTGNFQLIRSSQPKNDQHYDEIKALGIRDVIIFKTDTRGEVKKEISGLESRGINTHHIPFKWADHDSFREVCKQSIAALKIIKNSWNNGTKALLHCSHGQDRTGYIVGLVNLLDEPTDLRQNFQTHLCEGGYGSGNPSKPFYVVNKIRQATTNLYLKMSWKILEENLTWESLSYEVCDVDPGESEDYQNSVEFEYSSFRCEASSRF